MSDNKQRDEINSKSILLLKDSIPSIEAIYLFGSFASGKGTKDSDIDLAYLSGKDVTNLTRWDIQEKLAQQLGTDVDLVDLHKASEVMQFQVVHEGMRIFTIDDENAENYADKVYSLYVDLCDLRKPIIDNIQESGSIYG